MSLDKKNKNLCIICLKNNVFFDWTEQIFEFSGPSYKECYTEYTKLQEQDDSTHMLCVGCGNDLRNIYQLKEKALLTSDKKANEDQCRICFNNNGFFDWTEAIFEFSGPSYEHCYYKYLQIQRQEEDVSCQKFCQDCADGLRNSYRMVEQALASYAKGNNVKPDTYINKQYINEDEDKIQNDIFQDKNSTENDQKKKRVLLCTYCPRSFSNHSHLILHESRHRHRERNVICPICGLKFYDMHSLKSHSEVHNENREATFKCDFCSKAFYSRAGINYHRAKHLGNLTKCQLCPKEYYRKVDLNRHMLTHDAASLFQNVKKPPKIKFYRECDICGLKVRRDNWKCHQSKHLNKKRFECSICSKGYFCSKSVNGHIRSCHDDIPRDERKNYIIKLDTKYTPRVTPLMVAQKVVKLYTENDIS